MSTEQPKQEPKTEEEILKEQLESLPSMLSVLSNAPAKEQIEQWKTKYGDVFVSGFTPQELFVFKTINREEWVAMNIANQRNPMQEWEIEEMVCESHVLWPKPFDWKKCKAGTVRTLHEQIMQNSNFLPPAAAISLVAKL